MDTTLKIGADGVVGGRPKTGILRRGQGRRKFQPKL